MGALDNLEKFKVKFDREIEKYLNAVIAEIDERDVFEAGLVSYVKKIILAGGKRLRPALMYYGYLAVGGKEKGKILRATVGIELVHAYLLIHDDIMDCDDKRHGLETIHCYYKRIGNKLNRSGDAKHFGNSIAIIAGDIIGALGNQTICKSEFNKEFIIKALTKLQSILSTTVIGQLQDILVEYKKKATEEEIWKMYENKTAKYTMEGPLHLGAILGGANDNFLRNLSKYAIPIGVAFQIQDDILGVFSSEKKMGKKIGSDIIGGKQTLLVVKAMERSNKNQERILKSVLGKQNLSVRDIQNFKKIIVDTGSLDYAKKLANKFILKAKKKLARIKMNKEAKIFLNDIADYMIQREL